MIEIHGKNVEFLRQIPFGIISKVFDSDIATKLQKEYREIEKLYYLYKSGVLPYNLVVDNSNVAYKKIKSIINKEARFMFSQTPDFILRTRGNEDDLTEDDRRHINVMQDFVNEVLDRNVIGKKLVKAAKDCFVGKRVGWCVNFNEKSGIKILFFKSLNFYVEYNDVDEDELKRFVYYVYTNESDVAKNQRVFVKDYRMEDGLCAIYETTYDGAGYVIEETKRYETDFTYIPCGVIANDGMLGESDGESEVNDLQDIEKIYNRLNNWDIDADKASMNPTRYTVDMDAVSTKNLPISAGSYWDLQSSLDKETAHPQVGLIAPAMNHSNALKETMQRAEDAMREISSTPDVSPEKITGVITSGKGMTALYWDMIVRCNEKMQTWGDELKKIIRAIVDGALLNPNIASKYTLETLFVVNYKPHVEMNYAIQQDEADEKRVDMEEVTLNIMSRQEYNRKWRKMTDKQSDVEMRRIIEEQAMLNSSEPFSAMSQKENNPQDMVME